MSGTSLQDMYGAEGGAPPMQEVNGTGGHSMDTRANPDAFGAGVGSAISNVANKFGEQIQQYQQMATEAKVNDDFANKYAPAAAQLRTKYDQLRGQDKVAGYGDYISGLQELNTGFAQSSPNPVYKHLMGGLIDRHVSNEIDGASRELSASQKVYSDQSTYDLMKANNGYAAQNYNNPSLVKDIQEQNDAHITINAINNGADPTDPDHAARIEEAQRVNTGAMAMGMINRASNSGDLAGACKIRAEFSQSIPGYQKLEIDKNLHAQDIIQMGANGSRALRNGQPLPVMQSAPAPVVQATVADAAMANGVDHNVALTILRIESSDGQNLGTRGTIGQGKTGGSLQQQAAGMMADIKTAQNKAEETLGRAPEGWEIHAVYEQGVGGGPALMKADQNDKAIDVLLPLYKDPKDAKDAIIKNGGNLTMSAGDFLGHIHDTYQANAGRAAIDLPPGVMVSENDTDFSHLPEGRPVSLSDAIMAPHTQTGPVIQPAATPLQALENFDAKSVAIVQRINAIPNVDVRNGVMEAFNRDRKTYETAANLYTSSIISQAHTLAADPNFTDIKQMSPDMFAVATDRPAIMNYMQKSADDNLEKSSGVVTKDQKEKGPKVLQVFKDIGDGKVTSPMQLMDALQRGDITISGYDWLNSKLSKDEQGTNNTKIINSSLDSLKKQVMTGEDGKVDPVGQDKWNHSYPAILDAFDKAGGDDTKIRDLADPDSKNYVGNLIKGFIRPAQQQAMDLINAQKAATEEENKPGFFSRVGSLLSRDKAPDEQAQNGKLKLLGDIEQETDPDKKAALIDQGAKQGFWKARNNGQPTAPISE